MNDEPLLKERLLKLLSNENIVQEVVELFNEHSKDQAILNWKDKDRLKRLERLQGWLEQRLEMRDETREQERRDALGDRYHDYLSGEISAIEWVVKFVKEHSV